MDRIKEFLTGSGSGSGWGWGDGSGSGWGSGSGSGSGDGSGSGSGDGRGIIFRKIEGKEVHYIDNIPTVITKIRDNIATGFIVNPSDCTLSKCYVVKDQGLFAHGKTVREAMESLREKIESRMSVDEKIATFLSEISVSKKYPVGFWKKWHRSLTGSCKMGVESWVKSSGIDLKRKYTVFEFIEKTISEYGGDVISRLKNALKEEAKKQ